MFKVSSIYMANEIVLIGFYIAIFLFSVIIHEVSHGVAALYLGDATAKYAGRLNLNPLRHLDLYGSILLPIMMFFFFGFPFGWAKPVPYNPYNLRNQKWGPALVALGGPGSNIILALVFGFAAKLILIPASVKLGIIDNFYYSRDWGNLATLISGSLGSVLYALFIMVVFWNVLLAFFNLIPFPPLDGSKLLFSIVSLKTETVIMLEQFGFLALFLFIILFSAPLGTFLHAMLNLFFGLAL